MKNAITKANVGVVTDDDIVEFDTAEELLRVPFVAERMKHKSFKKFFMMDNKLMAEFTGKVEILIGYVDIPYWFDLESVQK